MLLCVCGSVLGGWAGFKLATVTYQSRAALQVKPIVLRVMDRGDEEKGSLPMFEAYVQAQANMLQGERVRNEAMEDREWVALKRGNSDKAVLEFVKSLHVTHDGQFVYVDMVDKDPQAARVGAKAVISAFMKFYTETDKESGAERMNILEGRRSRLEGDMGRARARVLEMAGLAGTDNLESRVQFKSGELQKYETELNDLRRLLAGTAVAATQPAGDPKPGSKREISIEEIASVDRGMAKLYSDRMTIEERLRSLRAGGILQSSPRWHQTDNELTEVNASIELYAAHYRELADHLPSPTALGMPHEQSLDRVRARFDDLEKIADKARQELLELGQQDLRIKQLKAEADDIKQDLDTTHQRIEQLKTEGQISGRITVASFGDRALEPHQDDRLRFAAIGWAAGGLLGLGLVLGVGFSDRRLRFADDTASRFHLVPLLGLLPELPNQSNDPEAAALVSHCVHQIRGLLQIQGGNKNHSVFAVTSPVAGTGKTTLTHALGVSFAHANSRTLLIDCDMVGGGLSARVDAIIRRKLGKILRRSGRVTPDQLNQALRLARGANKRIGQMLLELDFIEEADLTAALAIQNRESMGLLDAMTGEEFSDCIGETGVPGLSILPLGRACSEHVSQLSPIAIRHIIEQARRKFDIILIDTGPIPGSLEASVVAAAADGVILAVSRGEHRPLAEHCLNHLHTIGARVIGFVFNRARGQDVYASGTKYLSSSHSMMSRNGRQSQAASPRKSDGRAAGSVVNAVSTRVPSSKNDPVGVPKKQVST